MNDESVMSANPTLAAPDVARDDFPPRAFSFTDEDFSFLRKLITAHTSIQVTEMKREMVYGRVSRRLRQLGLTSFSEYCKLLQDKQANELGNLINAITTNLTSFFRENHHFEYLERAALPIISQTNVSQRRIRIWSAGCSTGEEAYSIAMAAQQAGCLIPGWDLKILATDIDTNVLEKAKLGVYPLADIERLPVALRRRAFLKGQNGHAAQAKVRDEIRNLVTFLPLNLIEVWPMHGPFDAIFCRNVVIYFDRATQMSLFDRFAEILAPGGFLFIGHSETLFGISSRFELIGQTIYRKRA